MSAEDETEEIVVGRRHYILMGAFVCAALDKFVLHDVAILGGHLWDFALVFAAYFMCRHASGRFYSALAPFLFCTLGEFVQLAGTVLRTDYPWVGGVPILGGTFDWWDIAAYALGAGLAVVVERIWPIETEAAQPSDQTQLDDNQLECEPDTAEESAS